jgi:hypothetical protein
MNPNLIKDSIKREQKKINRVNLSHEIEIIPYKTNKKNYEFQFITSLMLKDEKKIN